MKSEKSLCKNKKCEAAYITGLVIFTLVFILAVFVLISTIKAKSEGRDPTFFGYSFSIVKTGSMEPEIYAGEMLFIKTVEMSEIKEGDNVIFRSLSGEIAGERVVHEVIEIGSDEQGTYFITKGKSNPSPDSDKVREQNFLGKEAGHSVFLGKVYVSLTRVETLILIVVLMITIPVMIKQLRNLRRLAVTKSDSEEV